MGLNSSDSFGVAFLLRVPAGVDLKPLWGEKKYAIVRLGL